MLRSGNLEMLRVLIASGADLLSLTDGGHSIVDSECLASQMDAASLSIACECFFASTCHEVVSKNYYSFNRVVCGLSSQLHIVIAPNTHLSMILSRNCSARKTHKAKMYWQSNTFNVARRKETAMPF